MPCQTSSPQKQHKEKANGGTFHGWTLAKPKQSAKAGSVVMKHPIFECSDWNEETMMSEMASNFGQKLSHIDVHNQVTGQKEHPHFWLQKWAHKAIDLYLWKACWCELTSVGLTDSQANDGTDWRQRDSFQSLNELISQVLHFCSLLLFATPASSCLWVLLLLPIQLIAPLTAGRHVSNVGNFTCVACCFCWWSWQQCAFALWKENSTDATNVISPQVIFDFA